MKVKLKTGQERELKRGELKRIAAEHLIDYARLYQRIRSGWTLEEALSGKRHVPQPQKCNETSFKLKGEEPRDRHLGIRVTETEQQEIARAVEASGETQTEWLVAAALAKVEGRVIPPQLFEKIKRLSKEPQQWLAEQLDSVNS